MFILLQFHFSLPLRATDAAMWMNCWSTAQKHRVDGILLQMLAPASEILRSNASSPPLLPFIFGLFLCNGGKKKLLPIAPQLPVYFHCGGTSRKRKKGTEAEEDSISCQRLNVPCIQYPPKVYSVWSVIVCGFFPLDVHPCCVLLLSFCSSTEHITKLAAGESGHSSHLGLYHLFGAAAAVPGSQSKVFHITQYKFHFDAVQLGWEEAAHEWYSHSAYATMSQKVHDHAEVALCWIGQLACPFIYFCFLTFISTLVPWWNAKMASQGNVLVRVLD